MIYKLEKAKPEGMRITKKGETAPLKFYNGVVSARLAVGMHPTIKGGYDTGLNETTQKEFEEKMGLEAGTLGLKSEYWAEFGILVGSDGLPLNDEDPSDELKIYMLKRRKDVAQSKLEIATKPNIKWLLHSEESEAVIENNKRDYLIKALTLFSNMTLEDKKSYLESQKVNINVLSDTVISKKVGDEAEKKPKHFLLVANDERKADRIFANELIKFGILKMNGSKYINEDNVPVAYDDNDFLVFLADKNNTSQVAVWKKQLVNAKKR